MTARGRVLLTGASGFMGPRIAGALQAEGYSVRAASCSALALPGTEAVILPDLAQDFDARPLVDGMDYVVHLAGIAHATTAISDAIYHAVNAEAPVRLAAAARAAGAKRFLLMSSVRAQTGPVAKEAVREDQVPCPTDAYGRSKLAGEKLLAQTLQGSATEFVVLRPVLVYGPGVKGNMAALERLARLRVPLPLASFRGRRSLLSLANLASAVCHCLVADAARGGTFLVADSEPATIPEIVSAMRKGLGRRPGSFSVPAWPLASALRLFGKSDVANRLFGDLIADTSALRATGWSPKEETLAALAAAMAKPAG